MSEVEKKVVAGYASMLRGLSKEAKQELINVLSESLTEEADHPQQRHLDFDGFIPEKTAEEIIEDLRSSRHFREKDLSF